MMSPPSLRDREHRGARSREGFEFLTGEQRADGWRPRGMVGMVTIRRANR